MRYMIINKVTPETEAGVAPGPEVFEAMGALMEDLNKAGVLLAGEGLGPSSTRTRVVVKDGRRDVVDGPFAEAKELIGGFVLLQVRSKDEAMEWAGRMAEILVGTELEVARVLEAEDYPEESLSPELAEKERRMRDELASKNN